MAQITVIYKDFEEMQMVARAILGLYQKADGDPASTEASHAPTPQVPVSSVPAAQASAEPAPYGAPAANTVPAAPTTNMTPPAPTVQTAAQTYTADDLARAAITLVDAGRMQELQQLLANFGVEALPMLRPDQYGAFATALRGLGARI